MWKYKLINYFNIKPISFEAMIILIFYKKQWRLLFRMLKGEYLRFMLAALPELLLPLNQVGLSNLKRHTLHYFLWLQRRHHNPHGTGFHWKFEVAGVSCGWSTVFRYIFSHPLPIFFIGCNIFSSNPILLASKKPSILLFS